MIDIFVYIALGLELGFRCISHVYHTLWDPLEIIRANGGSPPVTYQAFSVSNSSFHIRSKTFNHCMNLAILGCC